MNKIKVGINGFGRIGRITLRAMLQRDDMEVVAINDLLNVEHLAYLLKYDSVHGKLDGEVHVDGNNLVVNGNSIRVTSERDPSNINWGELNTDVVAECTGIFTTMEKAELHLHAGAKKVAVSAPSKDIPMFVMGVNSSLLNADHKIVSNASCTTNCLAPVAMILENNFGIEYGYMTTIHSYTGDQKLLDTLHKDLRRARATEGAMIPTSTGAAKALSLVLPSLKGKLDGTAIRVPTPNVSLIDFTVVTKKEVSAETINDAMLKASQSNLKGILGINKKPLVSKDFNHDPHSSIFDVTQTQVIKNKFSRVLAWYDNEWGFSNRMCDTAIQIASFI